MASLIDQLVMDVDFALRTISGSPKARRPIPRAGGEGADRSAPAVPLGEGEKRHAAALMRVNHVGEVCAQALYHAQARSTANPALREHFEAAAKDETDHLAWTLERIEELEGRPSILNPLWYAGAYALGRVAGRQGDATNLGFVVETERQVEQHLNGHLLRLPKADLESRALVQQMAVDEARHGAQAQADGARELPLPVRLAMRLAARVMTSTAYWI